MKNDILIHVIIYVVIFIVVIFIYYGIQNERKYIENIHNETIDSLNNIIDSINIENDVLKQQIDSSNNNIQVIEKWYEKEYDTILTQSTDSDCLFFREYLSKNL